MVNALAAGVPVVDAAVLASALKFPGAKLSDPSVIPPTSPVQTLAELEGAKAKVDKDRVDKDRVDKDTVIARLTLALVERDAEVQRLKVQLADP